jgi:hypothetical protein
MLTVMLLIVFGGTVSTPPNIGLTGEGRRQTRRGADGNPTQRSRSAEHQ